MRAHTDEPAKAAAGDLGASAYATGDHVAFAATPTLALAAHEAAHVVQQRGGVQLSSAVGAPGDAYEYNGHAARGPRLAVGWQRAADGDALLVTLGYAIDLGWQATPAPFPR